jgi:hypothetical protein
MTNGVLSQLKHSQKRCLSQHFHSANVDMTCLARNSSCLYRESIVVAGDAVVMVLSDQSFPPIVAWENKNKNCELILRVEEGLLGEIGSILVDFFADLVRPNGSLPTGRGLESEGRAVDTSQGTRVDGDSPP